MLRAWRRRATFGATREARSVAAFSSRSSAARYVANAASLSPWAAFFQASRASSASTAAKAQASQSCSARDGRWDDPSEPSSGERRCQSRADGVRGRRLPLYPRRLDGSRQGAEQRLDGADRRPSLHPPTVPVSAHRRPPAEESECPDRSDHSGPCPGLLPPPRSPWLAELELRRQTHRPPAAQAGLAVAERASATASTREPRSLAHRFVLAHR